jgi:quinol monooxygenase YgiN
VPRVRAIAFAPYTLGRGGPHVSRGRRVSTAVEVLVSPAMDRIARYGKAVARQGQGAQLAELLLAAAAELDDDPGCELYLINREAGEEDVIWVTELWRSQADLDASLERIRGSDRVGAVMALVEDWQMVELDLLGGKGP